MNSFKYINTIIPQSEFDFSRLKGASEHKGEMTLAVTFGIPKDPSKTRKIICELDLTLGSENDNMLIHIKSQSRFDVLEPVNVDTLENDVQEYCYQYAIDELGKRVSEITKLQIGSPINIPIPPLN